MSRDRCLVTGATGFIGSAVVRHLVDARRFNVRAAVRRDDGARAAGVERALVGDLDGRTSWLSAAAGVDVVVHLAARVHVMHPTADDTLRQFERVNVEGTLNLARAAAHAGVRRFVFVSSVGVHGNRTDAVPFSELDIPDPRDSYSASKRNAEIALRQLASETGMDVVIIRPPLVYGPTARGNFARLCRVVRKRVPLPFGSTHNLRSLIGLDNLVDFILTCIEHPAAANETLLACDGEDLSTPDLIRRLASAMGIQARLIPVSPSMLMMAARLLGRAEMAQRLLGSLQIDMSKARVSLGWTPPVSVDEGLRRAVAAP